jgi:hypothetical protein
MRTLIFAFVVGLRLGSSANAQVALPPTASATPAVAAPAVAAPAAAPQRTLWGFLGLSHENLAKCRAGFCGSGIGQVANGMLAPVSTFSGGVIGGLCPPGAAAAPAALPVGGPQGAQAAAAKIQAYQAEAKATIAAIEYLATVDCHYWPEAEAALIAALRANRVECVRLAAAQALSAGCCCTKATTEALRITVSGSGEDGNPSETSPRVKQVAFLALQRCLARPTPLSEDEIDVERPPIEAPVPALGSSATPAIPQAPHPVLAYYTQQLRGTSRQEVVSRAWTTLASLGQASMDVPRGPSSPRPGIAPNAAGSRPAEHRRLQLPSVPQSDQSVRRAGRSTAPILRR